MARRLVVADLSNIEGRILAYLAGEHWKLDAFRAFDAGTGPDLYNVTASGILGGSPYEVSGKNRNIFGKVPDLALGYEGGVGALQTFAKGYGVAMADHWATIQENVAAVHVTKAGDNLNWAGVRHLRKLYPGAPREHEWAPEQIAGAVVLVLADLGISREEWLASETVKVAWRARHPATVNLWRACKDAALAAIRSETSEAFIAGPHMQMQCVTHRGQRWLKIRLPSGRFLTYLDPHATSDGGITYQGYGTTDTTARIWGRQYSYGGKFVENACQAVAGDVLKARMPDVEHEGFEIVLTVHDEIVSESVHGTAEGLSRIMATPPDWAPDLPLAAAGFECVRYRK